MNGDRGWGFYSRQKGVRVRDGGRGKAGMSADAVSVFCEGWRVFLGEVGRMGVMLDGTGNIAGGLSLDNLDAERCTSGRF